MINYCDLFTYAVDATINVINDFKAGKIKGCSEHLDAQTVFRLKQYRIDHLNAHPGVMWVLR